MKYRIKGKLITLIFFSFILTAGNFSYADAELDALKRQLEQLKAKRQAQQTTDKEIEHDTRAGEMAPIPDGSTEGKKIQEFDISAIKSVIKGYYDNNGEWAGKYRIGSIDKIRLEGSGSNIVAHVRYEYLPLPGGNTRKSGYDQRIFYIQKNRENYTVNRMGDYMSASF